MDVAAILAEREKQYGSFAAKGETIQLIKQTMRDAPSWPDLQDDMKESLEMIATKIGRILHGNPAHHDSWLDIAGYAKLIADRLEGE